MGQLYEYDDLERRAIAGDTGGLVWCTCAYRSLVTGQDVRCGVCRPRTLVHVERGTPSQVVRGWDKLAEQERKPL